MDTIEQMKAWGFDPEPGEAPGCGTVPVLEDGDEGERWTIAYSVDGGEVEVELVDRSSNPHTIAGEWAGGIGELRRFLQEATRKAGA